jgi:hypothetical protein
MTRVLRFAGSAVRVTARGERALEVVRFLYQHVVDEGDAEPHVTLALDEDAQGFCLRRDGELVARRSEQAAAAEALLGESVYHLVDRSRGGLVLHAAAVSLDGRRAIVMPGTSGAGKTTLTAWLVARGAHYLSDELVWLPEAEDDVRAFTRLLNLKLGARPVLQSLLREGGHAQVWSWQGGDLVDPAALHAGATLSRAAPGLLLFPTFAADAAFELVALTRAQASHALLGFTANARNLARHGLGEAARLARLAPAFRLTYGGVDQLPDLERFLHTALASEP